MCRKLKFRTWNLSAKTCSPLWDLLTCDDIDVRVEVLAEADSGTVPLKPVPELLLHGSRATQSVQTHHLGPTPHL